MDEKTRQKHILWLKVCIDLANQSPPRPTNFRVGALLFDTIKDQGLATGYTLELPGNTHAEQCCLSKFAQEHDIDEAEVGRVIPDQCIMYTSMEPCYRRLSENMSCVERILQTRIDGHPGIKTIICGVKEPEKFVSENLGRKALEDAGIEVLYVTGLEDDILEVATRGHERPAK